MIERDIQKILEELAEIKSMLVVMQMNEKAKVEKRIFNIHELPFSKATAYNYEKKGLLKISRPNGPKGMSFVLKEDLEEFYRLKNKEE